MHTIQFGGTHFHYNGDFSGRVRIVKSDGTHIEILGDELIGFVAQYVREMKIAEIENMSADEILGLKETTRSC